MIATTLKRVFVARSGIALRSRRLRCLPVLMLAAFALALLPTLPGAAASPVHVATTLASSSSWLARFNAWRANAGVSALSENTTYSAGDYNHALYMVQTGQVTHSESTAYSQYTLAGDIAAQNSNIYVSSSTATTDSQAIDWWMGAPFHAMAMMDPRLATTGFGSYRNSAYTWQMGAAVNTGQGMTAAGTYPVYFPGNLSTEPLTSYSGNEFPDPQLACPGYTGLPLFIEVGGNVDTTAGPVHTLIANGTSLTNCVIDSTNATFAGYLKWRGGVIVFPQQPLQNGVTYTVALTVNSLPYTWSFTVGSTIGAAPPAGPPPVMPFKGLYTLDGYGGIYADNSPPVTVTAYWPGWSIVRTAEALPGASAPQSGFVLDGYGGLHPYGSPAPTETSGSSGHYWGWNIARDFAFLPDGSGGFVLDGFGGLHPFRVNGNTAPLQAQGNSYWGWDIARKVVIFSDGTGGYVLDGFGGLHPFGINGPPPASAASVAATSYWPGWDIARDVVLTPGNGNHSGYVLDGYGGLHPFHPTTDGSTMPGAIASSYWGWDIARAVWLLPGSATAGYTLDGYGGVDPFGGAPPITGFAYWGGQDIAKTLFGA
ncbi:MAG: CAP domain-containing protein [Candidatus Dormibacteraceae bacterium]